MSAKADNRDFREVLAAARARARGVKPSTPDTRPDPQTEPEAFEAGFKKIVDRVFERTGRGPQDLTATPAARPTPRNAAAVRIEWYVPRRFRECVLTPCPAPRDGRCKCEGVQHYIPRTPSQRNAHRAASEWAEGAGAGDGLTLALVGPPGTGKSHLLYAAVRRANERGVNAGAWGWFEAADMLRAAASEREVNARNRAANDKERLLRVQALALDEIRATSGTDYDGTALSNLMTRAYRECQDVIVSSNAADAKLEDIIGLAASSRLTQVVIDGPDYRRAHLRVVG